MLATFNKKTGKFLGFIDVDLNKVKESSKTIYKDVGDIDPETVDWKGDYETGELVTETKTISEEQVDMINDSYIERIFRTKTQIKILARQLNLISSEKTEEFEKFIKVINEMERLNSVYKEAYKKSDRFDYISYNDAKKEREKMFSGGLSESILGKHEIDLVSEDEDDKEII